MPGIALKVVLVVLLLLWPINAVRTGRVLKSLWFGEARYIERRTDPHRFWYTIALYGLGAGIAAAILFCWRLD